MYFCRILKRVRKSLLSLLLVLIFIVAEPLECYAYQNGNTATTVAQSYVQLNGYLSGNSGIGYAIAAAAAFMSWNNITINSKSYTSAQAAYATVGNAAYIYIHQKCNTADSYYRCCASFVSTCIKFVNADSSFGSPGVSILWDHVKNSNRWQLIATYPGGSSPNISALKAGDVVICSWSHIGVFVSGAVTQAIYPNLSSSYNFAHASIGDGNENSVQGENYARSAKLDNFESYVRGRPSTDSFYIYRCVKPSSSNGQKILTYNQLKWLKSHAYCTASQFHPSYTNGTYNNKDISYCGSNVYIPCPSK